MTKDKGPASSALPSHRYGQQSAHPFSGVNMNDGSSTSFADHDTGKSRLRSPLLSPNDDSADIFSVMTDDTRHLGHNNMEPYSLSISNDGTPRTRRSSSRTPTPQSSPDRSPTLSSFSFLDRPSDNIGTVTGGKRRSKAKLCLLVGAIILGLMVPVWVFSSGVITLDRFNDVIRYLPGYSIFANNLIYLVMFLLLVSFSIIALFPTPLMMMIGLPFHLLIFAIFNRLMDEWLLWCVGCYTVLFLAPFGSQILNKISARGQPSEWLPTSNHGRKKSSLQSTFIKYSPLNSDHNSSTQQPLHRFGSFSSSIGDRIMSTLRIAYGIMRDRFEELVYLFNKQNRNSYRWRLLLAITLLLTYVVPVIWTNEPRTFDPARSSPLFDVQHPVELCPASPMVSPEQNDKAFEEYWQEYLKFHHQMVTPEEDGGIPEAQKRFLIYQPSDDGLGNRLQALLSAVVEAIITKRAIILDWVATPQCNANFTDLFQSPKDLAWNLNSTQSILRESNEYKTKPEIWYPYCRNCALRSPISPNSTWSNLLCDKDLGLDSSLKIIQIFSTQWYLPVLQHNPHWHQKLCQMFPGGGANAFQVLAKRLLHPSTEVQEKIDSVMHRIPKGKKLVGLQVRRTENNAVGRSIEDSFLECATQVVNEELNPQGAAKDRVRKGLAEIDPNAQFVYYLATDYRPTRAHFQGVLGDRLFVLENTFQSHGNNDNESISESEKDQTRGKEKSQTEAVARNSIVGVQAAVAEMMLLAQADRIVSSPYSTFGYFAHAYANVQPNIVKRDGTCIHRKSTQPCFQYWFGFANGGASCSIRSTIEMSEDYDCWL